MLCFKGSGDNEVSCYGTPKAERKKKPRSAKKSATDPIVYETTMNDHRNGNLSARQNIPGGVEYNQISRRIIALTYPTNGSDSGYRHSIKEISEKLRRNYSDKYKVFNVSQKRSDLGRANAGSVVELGWPDQLAPPLDRLCSICKQIENWLNTNPENLVVIHCKGWRSRAAIVIAAYMHYTNICAGDESVEDRFGMKIFSEKFLGVDGQPSHKRYVRYFANLLSGTTKVNPAPIFLTNISLKKISGKGIVLKIYERMKPVYSSQPISIKSNAEIEIDNGLSLRGDVLVKCFEKRSGSERSLVFQCQFNTCALDLETQRPILHFYREELDLITSDRSLDSQAAIEFSFVFEAPKEKKFAKSSKRSLSLSSSIGGARGSDQREEFSRADSYENFDRPEDDRSISTSLIESPHPRLVSVSEGGTTSALYTELQKTTGTTSSTSQQPSPLDGADSGIGSDSPKQTMAPPVPPKPRRPSSSMDLDPDDPMRSAYEDSTIGRDHSVLPASVRPSSRTSNHHQNNNHQQNHQQQTQQRAPSPAESTATGRSATPRIEPDLVAKDRYDPSSKCFSYVPAKALKEHYTAPKKPPTSRRQSIERSDLDIPTMDKESLRNISITPTTELTRRAETPKWDSVVDKIAPKIDLPDVRKDFRQLEKERYNGGDYFSKTLPNGYAGNGYGSGSGSNYGRGGDDDEYEKPVIVDQAKKAPPPRRRGRYGSYSTTNDDYTSDMDDLMDPEFYLSYSAAPTPPPERFAPGSKSVELPRKQMKTISQRDLDEIDSIIESTTTTLPPARSCYTPKPEPPRPSAERDAFRLRNCRSVNSGPTTRKLFSNERYDSITDAENPDDWLKTKLRTLHSKRGGYPDAMQRKHTEKKLLEELKNANPNNQLQKGEYVSEGIGQQQNQQPKSGMNDSQIDLLEEYQKEEERLRNTRSPFTAIDDFRSMNRAQTGTPNSMIGINGNGRYGRGTTPTSTQIIRSKPPTPPPRERSKSPTIRSPQPFRKSATPSAYQQERNRIASSEYLSDDEDDNTEFSHLHSLVNESNNGNGKRAQTAEPSNYYSNGTGTKSILKRNNNRQSQNDTPISYADSLDDRSEKKDIYASPVPSSRRFGGSSSATRTTSFGEDSLPRGGGSSYASIDSPRVGGASSATSTPLPFSPGRSETPAFPVNNRETPLPFHPLLYQGAASGENNQQQQQTSGFNSSVHRSNSPRSMYYGQSRRSSMTSVEGGEVIHHHPVFVKDTSKYWYKPTISREEAINMLRDKSPGTFVVRDSNSFPGAFGLALKVAKPPDGVLPGDGSELVRHFLIEPSSKGVKLKGCNNEPVFGTLAALVYQHSITPMALPCRLLLPEYDPASTPEHLNAAQALLEQGAACNVTYIYSFDTESLTGPEAVRRAVHEAMEQYTRGIVRAVNVHFKVSSQGITLTDNTRTLFFRRHYPTNSVIYAGIDPEDRKWDNNSVIQLPTTYVRQARVFGFVARKISTKADNACHVFAELDPEQPATAVVNFITKVMMGNSEKRGRTLPPV